jgi:hypothetical protein
MSERFATTIGRRIGSFTCSYVSGIKDVSLPEKSVHRVAGSEVTRSHNEGNRLHLACH